MAPSTLGGVLAQTLDCFAVADLIVVAAKRPCAPGARREETRDLDRIRP